MRQHGEEAPVEIPAVLLVGNPNTGKTSLFNALTGLRARTANYPGITVDVRKARISLGSSGNQRSTHVTLIDLPGQYSLEPTSLEEQLASDFIRDRTVDSPAAIVMVVDATNLAQGLFLASQVLELHLPTIVALSLFDAAKASEIDIDLESLANELSCPVVAVSARTGMGLSELRDNIRAIVTTTQNPPIVRESCTDGCTGCPYSARHGWTDLVYQKSVTMKAEGQSRSRIDRWLTAPLMGTLALLLVMVTVFFAIFSMSAIPMAAIEGIFGWVAALVDHGLPTKPLNVYLQFALASALTVSLFAAGYYFAGVKWTWRSMSLVCIVAIFVGGLPHEDFRSLAIHGVIGGVAGVVVFLPQICILFFFITLLEDSGYLARAAFVMERLMRCVGLPGKAFVPMLSAHACAIPGIMATRTIESWRDRLVTILVLPFLTCSARLPVYAMIAALLFGRQPILGALMFAGAYLLGLVAALVAALCLKMTLVKGESSPLVIELPPYRLPSLKNAFITTADRALVFLRNAGSVILLISVVMWAIATYPKLPEGTAPQQAESTTGLDALQAVNESQRALEYSFAGRAGKLLEPVFAPLGFDWKINVGVVSSFAAREVLVSTLSILHGVGEGGVDDEKGLIDALRRQKRPDGTPVFTTATSFSVLVFYVLAMQCLPTQAVTRRETGSWKWALFQFVAMTVIAYAAALIVFQSLAFLGLHR